MKALPQKNALKYHSTASEICPAFFASPANLKKGENALKFCKELTKYTNMRYTE